MKRFSERQGIINKTAIQLNIVDEALRNSIWNLLSFLIKDSTEYTHPWKEMVKVLIY